MGDSLKVYFEREVFPACNESEFMTALNSFGSQRKKRDHFCILFDII